MQLDEIRSYADGLDHPEGVAVGPDGTVWAGGEAGQVYRVTADGGVEEVASTGGFLLGLALDAAGRVYACDPRNGAVMRIDPDDATVGVWSKGPAGAPFRSPNFPVFDDGGRLYVTDSGEWKADDGHVVVVEPDGTASVWTDQLRRFPNGCALTADGSALLVIESLRPGVSRVPILPDGSAGEAELVVELPGSVPDGLAVDVSGGFYVACYRPDRLYYVDASGAASVVAEDPEGTVLSAPTNCVFAGPDLRTLVVGSLGRWNLSALIADLPGVPLRYPVIPR